MRHSLRSVSLAVCLVTLLATAALLTSSSAFAQDGFEQQPTSRPNDPQSPVQRTWVMKPSITAVTPPLYEIKDKYVFRGFYDAEEVKRPSWLQNPGPVDPNFEDQALQKSIGPMISVNHGQSFDGIGQGFTGPNGTYTVGSVPPDTDVAVGTTQVISLDNTGFAVFDKSSGAVLAGPFNTNSLWSSLGTSSICEQENDGDGIVKYDQLAQRWLITQFALGPSDTGPFAQCVAISQTADATGSWTVFQFTPGSNGYFPDYPKLGVWTDAYSITFDMFNSSGTAYEGGAICGIDRNALLNGNGNPTIVCAQLSSSDYALLPVDLDGATYPASGAKELYIENSDSSGTSTALYMYRAKFNFTAGTITVDPKVTITVSTYSNRTCSNTSQCVPQPTHTGSLPAGETFASESKLDTLAAHEMFRAPYRNFGTYESIAVSGPVLPSGSGGSGSNTAERWYEIRTPFTTPTVYQQSTFSPDTSLYRWMGSIAEDHQGNMLMGYSGSSSTVFPSVYITGRLNGDTLSMMESESQVYAGLNSQVNISGYAYGYRWGDYTAMMIDPDDCTFWYTGEYLKQAGLFNWSTRVLSFSFPSCSSNAAITLPIPGSTMSSNTANFKWLSGTGDPSYTLSVGSTQGGSNYCTENYSAGTYAASVSCLPTDGSTFWVRMTTVGGAGGFNDYQYTAASLQQQCPVTFPNPGTQIYGNSPITLGATDTCSLPITYTVNSGPGTVNGNMLTITGAGTIVITAAQAGNGSYAPSSQQISITVNKATLTVTATSASMTYGGTVPSLTYNMTGFVGSDNQGNSTTGSPNESTTVTSSTPPGSYPITISQGTLASTNYSFTFVNGTLTVNQATLTVTANSGSMTYGGMVPALTYMMSGFVNGDNQGNSTSGQPNESTTATSGSPVGSYPITITQGTLTSTKYTFNFTNGTLTIGPATLTVTADNKTITEGQDLPTFTASYSGFVNGDGQGVLSGSPSLTTDAPGNPPPVGTYNIFAAQGTLSAHNYVFTFVNGTLTVNAAVAQLTSPPKNTMLSGSSVTFTWSHETNAVSYQLLLGSAPGGSDLASVTTSNLSTMVNNLPTNGSYVYATLNGSTDGMNYTLQDSGTYVAYTAIGVMTTPAPGSQFTGTSVTFNWTAGASSSAYWLDAGSTPGGNNYEQSGNLGNVQTLTVNNLPNDGSTVYVTLWSYSNGQWLYNEYQYTAYNNASIKGVMQTPAPGSQFTGTTVTFNWSAGTQSTAYWLDVGSTSGGNQYYQSGNLGNSLTATVNGLPNDGSTVYVTLWSLVNGHWLYNEYTYTAYSLNSGAGQITSPTPGSTLTGSTVTFQWTPGSQSTAYWLDIGNVPGGNQYFQSGNMGNVTQVTVNNLPVDGSTLYVTLYSLVNGQWIANAYTYTAFTQGNGLAVMQTPAPGSQLSGNPQTFTWSAGTGASGYWVDIGSAPGGNQYYQSGNLGLTLSTTVSSLPANGSEIYVTLYTLINGTWYSNAYMYQSNP